MRPPFSSIFCWGTCVFRTGEPYRRAGLASRRRRRAVRRRGGGVGAILASRRRVAVAPQDLPALEEVAHANSTLARDVGLIDIG